MSQEGHSIATDLLTNYKKKIVDYINSANQGEENKLYLEYLSRAQALPDEKITTTAIVLTSKSQVWERHPVTFSCPTRVIFNFLGLAVRSVELSIFFPAEIYGPNQINPRLFFKTRLPRPWLGGFGANLTLPNIGMYPFDRPELMAQEIAKNATENLVDKMCDFLNHSNETGPKALRANLDYLVRKWSFIYEYSAQNGAQNRIPVPLYVLYDSQAHTSTVVLEVFVRKEMWLPPAEAIMRFLEPLVDAASYFNEKGELYPDGPHYEDDYLLSKAKGSVPAKGKSGLEPAEGGFRPAITVERDEFGFVLSGNKKTREFGGSDLGNHTQIVDQTRRQLDVEYQKRLIVSEMQKQELQQGVKAITQQFKTGQEWFAAYQNKQFKIAGDPAALPLKIKGNVSFLIALKPPFILSFARDQLRLKKSLTSAQAQDILFEIFKTGYLQTT